MTNHNSNDTSNKQQILFIKSRGVRVPVRFDIFKHGGGIYLTIQNQNEGVYLGLVGAAANMAAEFRAVAAAIESAIATKDQGHITRAPVASPAETSEVNRYTSPQTTSTPAVPTRLNPGATNWDWLTPEMVVQIFEQSPILGPIADDVKAALKSQLGFSLPAAPVKPGKNQLDLDLETIQPHLDQIIKNGKINKSEIARQLKITPGGAGNWERIVAVADALKRAA